ncbi:MAG: GDP-fucose protein O-fucosyltransferase-domain-containing protein [Podila humilis]|nr:MAG: GDP-fucose protein O-fucosyltransferase-domain-containing protein [Podila humilis]
MSRPGTTESGKNASYELPSKHHHIQVHQHHKPSSSSVARKKAPLQVHWHPSVNQHQQSKRTRHILSVLAVLAFFTSITFVLYHYSGCDITSGKCHRFPRHHQKGGLHLQGRPKASKLRPMILGESSVTIEEPGREQEKTKAAHPWSLLYGDPKIEWANAGESKDTTNDDNDTNDHSNDHLVKSPSEGVQQGNRNDDVKDEDKADPIDPIDEDPVFDVEPEDTEERDATEEYEDEDAESATPQQAYAGIWNEPEALTEDDYLELEEDYQAMAQPGQTFASRLDQVSQEEMVGQTELQSSGDDATPPEVKYMTYLPAEGLTNQFLGMLRAIMVAKSLGRTLVLPPITSSRHSQGKHNQAWSSFFDLPTFAYLTGVKMIEIKDLRDPELDSTKVEPLECHVAFGVGSLRALDDTAKEFLEQWKLEFRSVSASSRPLFEVETSEFDDMVSLLRSEEHERLLCLTNVNKIEVPANTEWNLYGQYFYFSPRTENLFERLFLRLQRSRPVSRQPQLAPTYDNENNVHHDFGASLETDRTTLVPKGRARTATSTQDNTAPFIVIHIRRQDFIEYCQTRFQHQLQQCLPTAQDLVERLQEVLADRADLRGVPVYVVTDEERTQKLAEMRAMGWQIVNHARLGTTTALGPFGPPVMDQMLMAKAQVVIGVRPSAFFRVAAHRQRDWSGRQAVSEKKYDKG